MGHYDGCRDGYCSACEQHITNCTCGVSNDKNEIVTRYVLHPGRVYSHDGDVHYISAVTLSNLYNVPYNQCISADSIFADIAERYSKEKLIHLYPRGDGNYSLPELEEEQ